MQGLCIPKILDRYTDLVMQERGWREVGASGTSICSFRWVAGHLCLYKCQQPPLLVDRMCVLLHMYSTVPVGKVVLFRFA
jgi:hypothetical protein